MQPSRQRDERPRVDPHWLRDVPKRSRGTIPTPLIALGTATMLILLLQL